jgi:hypothetical protein
MAKQKLTPNPINTLKKMDLVLPLQFLELCKMLEVTPVKVINDLVWNIASRVTFKDAIFKQQATEYFISQGYGGQYYTTDEIRQMIAELGVVVGLRPSNNTKPGKRLNEYSNMRDTFIKVWVNKWKGSRRKKPRV